MPINSPVNCKNPLEICFKCCYLLHDMQLVLHRCYNPVTEKASPPNLHCDSYLLLEKLNLRKRSDSKVKEKWHRYVLSVLHYHKDFISYIHKTERPHVLLIKVFIWNKTSVIARCPLPVSHTCLQLLTHTYTHTHMREGERDGDTEGSQYL